MPAHFPATGAASRLPAQQPQAPASRPAMGEPGREAALGAEGEVLRQHAAVPRPPHPRPPHCPQLRAQR